MNIRTFCVFPKGKELSAALTTGMYLCLPLDIDGAKTSTMDQPCIVFNIRPDQVALFAKQFAQPYYFFGNIADGDIHRLPVSFPREAIARTYTMVDKAIQMRKEASPRYRSRFDTILVKSLTQRSSGYQDWVLRSLIYRGLVQSLSDR